MNQIFKKFTVINNILDFNSQDETYNEVSKFYDEEPFPSYRKDDNKLTILSIGEKIFFKRI